MRRQISKLEGVVLSASMLMAGCGQQEPPEPTLSLSPNFERCLPEPLPPELYDVPEPEEPLRVESLPGSALDPETREKVMGAMVYLSIMGPSGAGFLLKPDIVVTAAHSAYSKDLSIIQVTDRRGNIGEVVGACYMRETPGRFIEPLDPSGSSVDFAMLQLSRPIGEATLPLGSSDRGDIVTLFGYPYRRSYEDPAELDGVVSRVNQSGVTRVITGVQSSCRAGEDEACSASPGMSGGPIVNPQTGAVVGFTVAGGSRTPDELLAHHNVIMGTGSNYDPVVVVSMPAGVIGVVHDQLLNQP